MAKKAPTASPPVDTLTAMVLKDPEPAAISLLAHADNVMHALTTRWGYPPTIAHLHLLTTHADRFLYVQAPPSVKYAQVGILASGSGKVTITAMSAGSDTTTLEWATGNSDEIAFASWQWSSSVIDDAVAAAAGPSLEIRATQTWQASAALRLKLNPANVGVGSPSGTIWALAIVPIWSDQTV